MTSPPGLLRQARGLCQLTACEPRPLFGGAFLCPCMGALPRSLCILPIMDTELRLQMIHAVALREGTARELAERFNMPVKALRAFVAEHEDTIRHIAEEAAWEAQRAAAEAEAAPDDVVLPKDLDELWISKKTERLRRYQVIADQLFYACTALDKRGLTDATTLRELRSFMRYAAEELGQLLHRGSGDMPEDATVRYVLPGVDMENLR